VLSFQDDDGSSEGHRKRPKYAQWQNRQLQRAVNAVLVYHWSKKRAAKEYGIPKATLQRYMNNCMTDGGVSKKVMGRPAVLTSEQEEELSGVIQDMERRMYGLTPESVRKLVYTFCEKNNIEHSFNRERQSAGKKWLKLFFERHPEPSLRKPEGTSIHRALGYNSSKVKEFEKVLHQELFHTNGDRRIPVENIFNVDETGVTVNQKPRKIIATKGKKGVATIQSAEKGKTITAICCVSAVGVYCPPFLIFPRARFKEELLDRGPIGAVGAASKSGWVNEEIFLRWFQHFIQFFQPQHRTIPCLLIMDGHSSHVNYELVQKARDNNVSLLVLPSHCTHKLQPLDVAVFRSFKCHYDRVVEHWLREHPGRGIQESNVAELFAQAWNKSATVANAVSGFAKARINPYSEADSDDEDYLPADVTDVPVAPDTADDPGVQTPVQTLHCSVSTTGTTLQPDQLAVDTVETTSEVEPATPLLASDPPAEVAPDTESSAPSCQLPAAVLAETTSEQLDQPAVDPTETTPEAELARPSLDSDPPAEVVPDTESSTPSCLDQPAAGPAETSEVEVSTPSLDSTRPTSPSFRELIPVPKVVRKSGTKHRASHAVVITRTPTKLKLQEAYEEKAKKQKKPYGAALDVSTCLYLCCVILMLYRIGRP